MDSSVYANKEFVAASKRWVNVYCSKDSGHGTEKVGDVEMCKIHPGIKCEEHVACNASSSGLFFSGTHKAPGTVWCDSTGKMIGKQEGSMSAKQVIEKMAEAEKAVGVGIGLDEYEFFKTKLAAGEKSATDGKVKDAFEAYTAVVKMSKTPGSKPWVDKAQAALDKIMESGKTRLADAMALKDAKDYANAKAALKQLAVDYKGQPFAKEIDKANAEVLAAEKAK
ncbi:MAG: hypothetical protein K8T20_15785 [Planctomycetes bacterium]|nr:hypothetical protein [Planctomycetota bacterium]